MTITLGSFSTKALTAQPFGYEGTARDGLTARTFRLAGLLTKTEWGSLISVYDTWRSARLQDPDTFSGIDGTTGSQGTTVALTIPNTQQYSVNGLGVTNLNCWFTEAPSAEQAGPYLSATATLVDVQQALQVLLRGKEKERLSSEALVPSFGTVVLGQATITLTKPMETRQDGPSISLTAAGKTLLQGALKAHKLRQIEGYISQGTFADVLTWYDTTVAATPSTSTWFPVSAPTANAEAVIVGGAKATRYTVALSAIQVL
jgi:hypothetical protein